MLYKTFHPDPSQDRLALDIDKSAVAKFIEAVKLAASRLDTNEKVLAYRKAFTGLRGVFPERCWWENLS